MYSTCQAGSCSSSATKLKTINEVDAFDGDGWGTRRTSGLPTLRNALALDCYSLAKKSRYEPPFHPASSYVHTTRFVVDSWAGGGRQEAIARHLWHMHPSSRYIKG